MRLSFIIILHIVFNLSNASSHLDSKPPGKYLPSEDELNQVVFNTGHEEPHFCPSPVVPLPTSNGTKSFWLDSLGGNPLANEGSTGALTHAADVCIIGSGITGVSAAWHLSQTMKEHELKTKVVILEARQFCSGATGRNGGHLRPNTFESFRARKARYNTSETVKSYTIERYTAESLVNFLKDRSLKDEVDLVESGHVTLFETQDEELDARADFAAASAAGLDLSAVRWIINEELIEKYGLSQKLNYTGVWQTGHNLWPCKLVTELFNDAHLTGGNVSVTLHTKTPVTSITRLSANSQWALHTPRGIVECTYALHATNAYAGHLLPFFAGSTESQESTVSFGPHKPLDQRFGITPTRGQVAAVRASVPASHFLWRNGWAAGSGGREYWFPRFQGLQTNSETGDSVPLIILGGGREFSGGNFEAGVSDDGAVNGKVSKALKAFLPTYFPGMFNESEVESRWEMEWTGIMGFTKIGDPFVGPILHPHYSSKWPNHRNFYEGQYIAAGYTGHGMVRAYACAEVVAGMIKAHITGSKWVIPEWFPERYLTWAKH